MSLSFPCSLFFTQSPNLHWLWSQPPHGDCICQVTSASQSSKPIVSVPILFQFLEAFCTMSTPTFWKQILLLAFMTSCLPSGFFLLHWLSSQSLASSSSSAQLLNVGMLQSSLWDSLLLSILTLCSWLKTCLPIPWLSSDAEVESLSPSLESELY